MIVILPGGPAIYSIAIVVHYAKLHPSYYTQTLPLQWFSL